MAKLSIPPLVTGVFIVCLLLFKLLFLFQMPFFEDPASYSHLVEIENVFVPSSENAAISHDLNTYLNLKLYYLFMGIIYFLFPSIVALKIAETMILGLLLFIIYRATKSLSRNNFAGFLSVIVIGTMPLLFQINQVSLQPHFFISCVVFSLLYLLVKSSFLYDEDVDDSLLKGIFKKLGLGKSRRFFKNYYVFFLVVVSFGMVLLSKYSLFIALVLLLTLTLLLMYRTSIKSYYQEFTIFFTLFSTGIFILFHREALFTYGFSILQGNYPVQLLSRYAESFDFIRAFVLIGMPLFLGGIYGIYFYLTNTLYKESAKITIYSSCFFAAVLCFIFKVGNPYFLLLVAGTSLSIIFSSFVSRQINHAKKYYTLNWSKDTYWLVVFAIILFGGLSINYTLSSSIDEGILFSPGEIQEIQQIAIDLPENSLLLIEPSYGSVILWFTSASILSDSNFLHQSDPTSSYKDITLVYENINSIKVQNYLQSFKDYSEIYIYLPSSIAVQRNISVPGFAYDEKCFQSVLISDYSQLYRYSCEVQS